MLILKPFVLGLQYTKETASMRAYTISTIIIIGGLVKKIEVKSYKQYCIIILTEYMCRVQR